MLKEKNWFLGLEGRIKESKSMNNTLNFQRGPFQGIHGLKVSILVPLGFSQYKVWVFKPSIGSMASKRGYRIHSEDNSCAEAVEPLLEFIITTKNVAGVGTPTTLLVFNNKNGFRDKILILYATWDSLPK